MELNTLLVSALVTGPVLSVAGAFFAVTLCMSPYHHIIAKFGALLASFPAGIIAGEWIAHALVPQWGPWGILLTFGYGFLLCWVVLGAAGHDDAVHWYIRKIREGFDNNGKDGPPKGGKTKQYKAHAPKRPDQDRGDP